MLNFFLIQSGNLILGVLYINFYLFGMLPFTSLNSNYNCSNKFCRGGGNNGDLPNSENFGEQLLNDLPPKSISNGMFDPACDYAKKIDNSWLSSSMGPFNFEKQLNTPKLSNFVGNWSIPSQDEHMNQQFEPRQSDIGTLNSMIKEPFSDLGPGKRSMDRIMGSISCFGHDMKMVEEYGEAVLMYF